MKEQGYSTVQRGIVAAFLLTGLLAAHVPSSFAAQPLALAFDGDAVVVSDLEPGAEVVYFTVARFAAAYVPRTERHAERLVDEDGDGEVRIALERAAPRKFLAVAVELASGRFGVLTPADSPAREVAFPAHSLGNGPGNRLDRLENDQVYVELLVVRPGTGAWALTTGDGAATDEGPSSDGLVTSSLASMEPVGDSGPPPEEYQKDDFLLRVAPRPMEYYALRIVR